MVSVCVNLSDSLQSEEEWQNVSEIVRLTFRTCFDQMKLQSDQIVQLVEEMKSLKEQLSFRPNKEDVISLIENSDVAKVSLKLEITLGEHEKIITAVRIKMNDDMIEKVIMLAAGVVCNVGQTKCLMDFITSVHTKLKDNKSIPIFGDLLKDVDFLLTKFQATSHVVYTWMNTDDSIEFEALFVKLSHLVTQYELDVDVESMIATCRLAKVEDEIRMREIVLNDMKQYESIKKHEARVINEDIANNVKLLNELKSVDKVEDLVTLRHVDVNMLTLGEVLGEGSFGIAYAAELRGIKVAVKKLKIESVEQKAELYKEALVMQVHQFPGVVRFFGVDDVLAPTMIVMEVAVCSVEDWLYNPSISAKLDLSQNVLQECCSIFAFLHSVGVIHRDIKPGNVLIMSDGHIKVSDFGLAQQQNVCLSSNADVQIPSAIGITATNPLLFSQGTTVRGTLPYMAPELIISDKYEYSQATDAYAFGIMMNEILSKRKPFDGMDGEELVKSMCLNDGELRPYDDTETNSFTLLCTTEPSDRCPISFLREVFDGENNVHYESSDTLVKNLLLASVTHTGYYTGQMSQGLKHGKGVLNLLNGDILEGEWMNDMMNGQGEKTTVKGLHYKGSWLKNCFDYGILIYENGDVYEGNWKQNLRNGYGKMTYSNGTVCTGHWNNHSFYHGSSTVTYSDGLIESIFFIEGSPPIDGNYHLKNGSVFRFLLHDEANSDNGETIAFSEGNIFRFSSGDSYNGKGSIIYSCGDIFEGSWNGYLRPHGQGTMTYANGDVSTGIWDWGTKCE